MFGAHAPYIFGAYGVALIVFAMLAAWVVLDHRTQKRALADLEARGIKRRSET